MKKVEKFYLSMNKKEINKVRFTTAFSLIFSLILSISGLNLFVIQTKALDNLVPSAPPSSNLPTASTIEPNEYVNVQISNLETVLSPDGSATVSISCQNNEDEKLELEVADIILPDSLTLLEYKNSLKFVAQDGSSSLAAKNDSKNRVSKPVSYKVLVNNVSGVMPVKYRLKGRTASGKNIDFYYTAYFRVDKNENKIYKSDIRIDNIVIPSTVKAGEEFDMYFQVSNVGLGTAANVAVSVELPAGFVNMSQANFVIPNLNLYKETFKVRIRVDKEIENKFHNIKISAVAEAADDKNQPGVPGIVYTGTLVNGGTAAGKPGTGGGTKPLIILESFGFKDAEGNKVDKLLTGRDYVLDFQLRNTSQLYLQNIKLSLKCDNDSIIPKGTSASFYEPAVPAKSWIKETLPVTVLPTAAAVPTSCTINMYYEKNGSEPVENTDNLTVELENLLKLEFTPLFEVPVQIEANALQYWSFNLLNSGKADVYNLRASLQSSNGDLIVMGDKSQYIGKVAAGSQQTTDFSFQFYEPGEKDINVVLKYETVSGKEEEMKLNYKLKVEAPVTPEVSPEDQMPEVDNSSGVGTYIKIFVVLIVLLIAVSALIFYILRKRKKNKNLDMDV